ncbi:very-long-chain 3-oxoacyl-CoA reductase-like [Colletes gigas]|uniref:very-long-chain 3-oxoacyl-CoA reductase-like n=1 Tax=Colletes gigas TaxID=935657 RepID=UPI001C9B4D71|nr:very-long-chain 3-oxoacyl-CoA reductase-like [Colletes gigas]
MLVEKIGYATIIYWGYKLSRDIIYKLYKNFFTTSTIDLYSMGKWAVITGCSHGIGKAYAEALAKIGLNVILVSPDTENLKKIASNIEMMYNVKTKVIKLDISEGLETYKVIEKEIFGLEIGVLINNLGMSYPHPEYFLDLPHKEKIYMSIVHCNVVIVTNMCRILLPQMVVRGKGVIVNVASVVAVLPSPLLTVFAATKAYIVKFTRDLQIEYARHGIIVQCLLPGTVTNHTTDSPRAGWMVPTPEKYVQSAIKTIGKENVTTGFLHHSILIGIIKFTYRLSPNFIIVWMINIMEGNRNNALRRYIG